MSRAEQRTPNVRTWLHPGGGTVTTERTNALRALLDQAEAAHGEYERTQLGGVYDQDWARWYARYALDNGFGALVGGAVTADELGELLTGTNRAFEQADPAPDESWSTFAARRLAVELAEDEARG